MSENRNDGNRVGAPDAIPIRDRLTDAQIDQVQKLLAQEREALVREREAMLTAVDEAVGKLLAQYERIKSELEASMRARVVETEALKQTLGEIRSLVVSENDKLVDVPTARRVN